MTDEEEIARLEAEIAQLKNQVDVEDEAVLTNRIQSLEKVIKHKSPGPAALDRASPRAADMGTLYCFCRKAYDQTIPMICCDVCDEWYHLSCVGMLTSEATCVEHYSCITCQKRRKKKCASIRYKKDEALQSEINQMMDANVVQAEITLAEAELQHLLNSLPPAPPPAAKVAVVKTPLRASSRTPAPVNPPRALPVTTPRATTTSSRSKAAKSGGRKSSAKAAKDTFICRSCRVPLSKDAKFCMECGTKVALSCNGCGAVVSAAAKFCSECGLAQ